MKSYEVQCSATELQMFEKTGAAQSFYIESILVTYLS